VSRCALEICVETVAAALAAEQGGADRLESCVDLAVGGTSPPQELLRATCSAVRIPVIALIRPRAGDFRYTANELERMRRQLDAAREAGARGVALGVLDREGRPAADALGPLVERARAGASGSFQLCFHRAFDGITDKRAALEQLVALGFQRVLTSGGPPRAADGLATLRELVQHAAGRIAIMPGGGVRAADARRIVDHTQCRELHSSAGMPPAGDVVAVDRLRRALDAPAAP
jgi:copper homeostasis protein